MKTITPIIIILLVVMSVITSQAIAQTPSEVELFISGTDGYDTYRIPAVVSTVEGTVLAFCEGRKIPLDCYMNEAKNTHMRQ